MPFRANECFFYEDGLSHESVVAEDASSDACYQALIDRMNTDPTFIGRVVEIDDAGKPVYETEPYPHVKEPEPPAFYFAHMQGRR